MFTHYSSSANQQISLFEYSHRTTCFCSSYHNVKVNIDEVHLFCNFFWLLLILQLTLTSLGELVMTLCPPFTFSPLIRFKYCSTVSLMPGIALPPAPTTLSSFLPARSHTNTHPPLVHALKHMMCTNVCWRVMPSYGHISSHNGIRLKLLRGSDRQCGLKHAPKTRTHASHKSILWRNLCGLSYIIAFCPWGRKLPLSWWGHSEHCSSQTLGYIYRCSRVRSVFKIGCGDCHANTFNQPDQNRILLTGPGWSTWWCDHNFGLYRTFTVYVHLWLYFKFILSSNTVLGQRPRCCPLGIFFFLFMSKPLHVYFEYDSFIKAFAQSPVR